MLRNAPIPENYQAFKKSLSLNFPGSTWPELLCAMWWDAKGEWMKSHDIAEENHGPMGSLIHAYLHRKEGDLWNAKYWYSKAGEALPQISLEEEAKQLVGRILNYTSS